MFIQAFRRAPLQNDFVTPSIRPWNISVYFSKLLVNVEGSEVYELVFHVSECKKALDSAFNF